VYELIASWLDFSKDVTILIPEFNRIIPYPNAAKNETFPYFSWFTAFVASANLIIGTGTVTRAGQEFGN